MFISQGGRGLLESKDSYTHVLSVVCPDDGMVGDDNHLVIKMWDVDRVLENKFRKYLPPSLSDCLRAVNWVEYKYTDCLANKKDFRLLVHCDAGVSRSPAIALGCVWTLSGLYFKYADNIPNYLIKEYVYARKQWCAEFVAEDSRPLRRFIDGRINSGVQPNQAVLEHFRNYLNAFPW